jgi:hypothetical protein
MDGEGGPMLKRFSLNYVLFSIVMDVLAVEKST